MDEAEKTATEIAKAIRERAKIEMGPWPRDLELFVFVINDGWSFGLSPAANGFEAQYRKAVLQIATELRDSVKLKR
jgi:hypothetical protein